MCKMWIKIVGLKPICYRKYAENAGGWVFSSVWSKNQNMLSEKYILKERNGKRFLNLFPPHSSHCSPKPKWTVKYKVLFQTKKYSCFLRDLTIPLRSPMEWEEWCFPGHLLFLYPCPPLQTPTTFSTPQASNSKSSWYAPLAPPVYQNKICVVFYTGRNLLHPAAGQGKSICVFISFFMRYNGGLKNIST